MTNSGTQRAELHKTIWSIANVLRGSVDGWDFKQYVLGFLFYRFISEDITSYLNEYEHQAGDVDFDYAKLDDATAEQVRKSMVEEKGYFILPSDLFANVRRCADADENLNETLQRVFKNIEGSAIGSRSESSLRGLFDDLDLNSRKLGDTVVDRNAKLVKVLNAIGDLDLGTESFADNKIDAFGDAYEYLMTMYAANAGKSGGEFFTPQEVSELLTRIATHGKSEVNKVYDPACGSGSLLLQSIKVLGKDKVRQGFFGQEKNLTTYNLCRINMFLHDVNYDHFNIAYGDTLINPQHWDDEPFEVIVSNPPYSTKWEGDDNPTLINDPRFAPAGVLAPKSKADLAFTMHMLSWLAADGTAAIVEFPGVLYRGGKEQKIRIEASSGLTEQEIQRMRDEAKANEARDREEREKVDKVNAADTLIFSTEKQLKEYGDKIPADKKANIESALAELKAAHAAGNVANIDSATTRLNDAWQAASQDMYSAQQQAGGAQQGAQDAGTQHGTPNNAGGSQNDGGVTDVEFEEVK